MPARRALAVATAAASLVAVAGCQKPTPLVTLVAGGTSVASEAACYAHRGTLNGCSATGGQVLPVRRGNTLGINVDPELTQGGGWQVEANGRPITFRQTRSYYTIPLTEALPPRQDIQLRVVDLARTGGIRGVWQFRLRAAT